ncbi:hypothetical protein [Taibaiella koreensis]|uniref:hypothetical protein n=1 Tax=Taibaiella koreensis TaxID=1268548 RepID=UPI000E599B64|nr:hypothetical protein [Taibaiella koreensis]
MTDKQYLPARWSLSLFLVFFLCCIAATSRGASKGDSLFRRDVQHWFDAWSLVSRQVYRLPQQQPVTFVFFDEQYIYTTSSVTAPKGEAIAGPDFLGQRLNWKKARLTDSITLPDKRRVPAGLMSFASPLEGEACPSFFVMPLVSFWQKADVTSKELGLDHLVTVVFLHEFSHCQQMQNFGKKITALDQAHHFGIPFSDDIIQYLYEHDSVYVAAYRKELQRFYSALGEPDAAKRKAQLQEGLEAVQERHQRFLQPKDKALPEIDAFFLTMEGIGQYSQYAWLVHPEGAGLPAAQAIEGMRRGGRWWSQDEGMVLFLLLAQLSPPEQWAGKMFGDKTESIFQLIQEQLKEKRP